jgi:GDP-L-fucose synthase
MQLDDTIYVAGHTGLVGSAICRALERRGFANLLTAAHSELDLTRQSKVEDFFARHRPRHVFLCAAKVGGIKANATFPADFIAQNLAIAGNVIQAAHRFKARKLLNLGSSCIFPRLCPQPMKEEHLLTGPLEPTNEPYAVAKIAAIKLCRAFNLQYGTDFLSIMPANLYGPEDNFSLETSHVLPAMIRKFHLGRLVQDDDMESLSRDVALFGPLPQDFQHDLAIREARSHSRGQSGTIAFEHVGRTRPRIRLWGSGQPRREFLHVDDLAEGGLNLMQHHSASEIGEFINIGSGQDLTIADLAGLIQDVVGFEGEVVWDSSMPDGTPRKLLDVSRMNSLGWQPHTSLQDGVRQTYQWYCQQLEKGCEVGKD